MKRYPILFGLRDLVEGNGYLAAVAMDGRALLHEQDDGSLWVEGVNPGGFAGTGNSAAEALESFRREYRADAALGVHVVRVEQPPAEHNVLEVGAALAA